MTWRWQWKSLPCVVTDLLVTWAAASPPPPLVLAIASSRHPPRCWAGHPRLSASRDQPFLPAIGVRWGERQVCIRPARLGSPHFPPSVPSAGVPEVAAVRAPTFPRRPRQQLVGTFPPASSGLSSPGSPLTRARSSSCNKILSPQVHSRSVSVTGYPRCHKHRKRGEVSRPLSWTVNWTDGREGHPETARPSPKLSRGRPRPRLSK